MTDTPPVDPDAVSSSAQLAKRKPTAPRSTGRAPSGGRPRTADSSNGVTDPVDGLDGTDGLDAAASAVVTDEPTVADRPATARPATARPATRPAAAQRSAAPTGAGPATTPPTADDDGPVQGTTTRLLGYRRQRFEARKVRRLVRHVDPWSMLKLSLLVSLCMWLMVMIAAMILWTVARNAGTIASVENFVNSSLSLQDWSLDGEFILRQFGLVTLLLSLGLAAALVIATLVFNLISDIIGGVWISVIEEESARPVAESNPKHQLG